jgi:hypothetical protein
MIKALEIFQIITCMWGLSKGKMFKFYSEGKIGVLNPNKLRNVAHYSAWDVNVAEIHEFE